MSNQIAGNLFQSTPPLRGATETGKEFGADGVISIHAPLAGGDYGVDHRAKPAEISIHAPLAGGDR